MTLHLISSTHQFGFNTSGWGSFDIRNILVFPLVRYVCVVGKLGKLQTTVGTSIKDKENNGRDSVVKMCDIMQGNLCDPFGSWVCRWSPKV